MRVDVDRIRRLRAVLDRIDASGIVQSGDVVTLERFARYALPILEVMPEPEREPKQFTLNLEE